MKKLIILVGILSLGAVAFAEAPKFGIYDGQRIYRAGSKDIPDKSKCTFIGDEEDVWCLTPATKRYRPPQYRRGLKHSIFPF